MRLLIQHQSVFGIIHTDQRHKAMLPIKGSRMIASDGTTILCCVAYANDSRENINIVIKCGIFHNHLMDVTIHVQDGACQHRRVPLHSVYPRQRIKLTYNMNTHIHIPVVVLKERLHIRLAGGQTKTDRYHTVSHN